MIDITTSINAVLSSFSTLKDLLGTAVKARDSKLLSEVVVRLNQEVLNTQEALFTHRAQLSDLQAQLLESTNKARELEEALRDRGRYSLFQIVPGGFALRFDGAKEAVGVDALPKGGEASQPSITQPEHYACQSCFEKGLKMVLQLNNSAELGRSWRCPACPNQIFLDYI